MRNKRTKEDAYKDNEDVEEIPEKRFYTLQSGPAQDQPGTSTSIMPSLMPKTDYFEMLEVELQQPQLNVQEIGRIIADGMVEKSLCDESLQELTKQMSKNIHSISNINIWSLTDDLNKGLIDSRLVVIGNAFLWNLLKSSMTTVRDKFDHYQFKMSTLSTNAPQSEKIEFLSSRVQRGQYIVMEEGIFRRMDLFEVYSVVVFRKTGDLTSKSKQFIKAYLTNATSPKCGIWHYSLRQSGTSHKKILQDIPHNVLMTIYDFMLALAGLAARELTVNIEDLDQTSRFFISLGDNDAARELEFENLKSTRDALLAKFKTCVTDVLNEIREMPYNFSTCELLPPPRGKPINTSECVMWRTYETILKRCDVDPSKENLLAKQTLEYKLMLNYDPDGRLDDVDLDVDIDK